MSAISVPTYKQFQNRGWLAANPLTSRNVAAGSVPVPLLKLVLCQRRLNAFDKPVVSLVGTTQFEDARREVAVPELG